MINLLPPDYKKNMAYARKNTSLRKWAFAFTASLFLTILIIAGGYLYMEQNIRAQSKEVDTAWNNLQGENIDATRKQLDEISANTKLVLQVLSKEILFSRLLRQLGASLPANTALEQIQIDKVEGGLSLKAVAKDIDSATQIQVNLEDPNNKIFQKADIEAINCTPPDPKVAYPCSVQLRTLFAKDSPYVYIPSKAAGEKKP